MTKFCNDDFKSMFYIAAALISKKGLYLVYIKKKLTPASKCANALLGVDTRMSGFSASSGLLHLQRTCQYCKFAIEANKSLLPLLLRRHLSCKVHDLDIIFGVDDEFAYVGRHLLSKLSGRYQDQRLDRGIIGGRLYY